MKKYAVVESDSTILITDKVVEKKDFILVGKRPFPKSRPYRVIFNGKKGIGFKVNLNHQVESEIGQLLIKKEIVKQIVKGLTKKFAWKEFIEGCMLGYIIKYIYDQIMKYIQEHPFQPQPSSQIEIPNPFAPISNAIMVIGIVGIIVYFIYKLFRERL